MPTENKEQSTESEPFSSEWIRRLNAFWNDILRIVCIRVVSLAKLLYNRWNYNTRIELLNSVTSRMPRIVRAVFLVLLVVFAVLMVLVGLDVITVSRPLALNEALLGGLLSLISAYLLYSQTHLLKKQVEIEDKLLSYETEPALEVISCDFRGNEIILDIANYGHGVAQDLEIECLVSCPKVDWYSGVPRRTHLQRYIESEDRTLEDSSIRPQEEPSSFIAKSVKVARIVENGQSTIDESAFETLMRELQSENDAKVTVSMTLVGKDTVGEDEYSASACEDFTTNLSETPQDPTLQEVFEFQK